MCSHYMCVCVSHRCSYICTSVVVLLLFSVCRRTGVTKRSVVLENDNSLDSVDLYRRLKSEAFLGK